MQHTFAKAVRGASDVDLALLIRFHTVCNNVYMYDAQARSCFHPSWTDVPSPIIFLSGRYNRKHIFQPPSAPKRQRIKRAMEHFEAKLKWRWHFKDSPKSNFPVLVRREAATTYSGKVVDPELLPYISFMRREVVQAAMSAVRVRKGHMHR